MDRQPLDGGQAAGEPSERRVEELVRQLAQIEAELVELTGGIDAIVDETSAAPFLLRQAQADLEEAQARYDRLVERMAAVVFEVAPDGELLFINRAVTVVTGFLPGELAGRRWLALLFPGELRREVLKHIERFRNGDVAGYEVVVATKDGGRAIFEVNTANHYGPGATLEKVIGFAVDITRQRQAERRQAMQANMLAQVGDAVVATDKAGCVTYWNQAAERLYGVPATDVLGCKLDPAYSGIWRDAGGENVLVRQNGEQVFVESSVSRLRDDAGAEVGTLAVIRDISARKQAQISLQETAQALARQSARLQVLHEMDQAILSAGSAPEMAQAIACLLLPAVGAVRISVRLIDFEQERVEPLASCGAEVDYAEENLGPKAFWLARESLEGRLGVVPDLAALPGADPFRDALLAAGIHCYLGVPLVAAGRPIGAVGLGFAKAGPPSQDTLDFLSQVTDQLAIGLYNARLFGEVQQGQQQLRALSRRLVRVQEAERRALSRDLHDTSGQSLTALQLGLGMLQRHLGSAHPAQPEVAGLREVADMVAADLHRLAVDLRPSALDRYGLVPALEQLISSYRKQLDMDVEFAVEGEAERLAGEVETALYRIVQESLTNVVRHAQASSVSVLVRQDAWRVQVIVEDNGSGFDADAAMREGRLGLLGMRERAEMMGGKLTIESIPGRGTTVFAEMPFETAEAGEIVWDDQRAGQPGAAAYDGAAETGALTSDAAELARAKALSDALVDIVATLTGLSARDQIVEYAVERSLRAVGAEMAFYSEREPGGWQVLYHSPGGVRVRQLSDDQVPACVWVERTHETLVVNDTSGDVPEEALRLAVYGAKSYVSVPVISDGNLCGIFSYVNLSTRVPFRPSEVDFLNRMASLVSLSLENVHLHEAEARHHADLAHRVEELQALLDLLPVGIGIAYDRECKVIRGNRRLAEMLGTPEDANISLSADESPRQVGYRVYFEGRELAPQELPMQAAAAWGTEVRGMALEVVREDGTSVSLLGYAVPLLGPDGDPRGAVAAFVDVTERQAYQAERERLIDDLQQMSVELETQAIELEAQNEELMLQSDELRWHGDQLEARVNERTADLQKVAKQLQLANIVLSQREAALRQHAELLDLTHDAVIVHSMDASIHFWNGGARELYGWSELEANGLRIHDLLHTVFPEPLEDIYRRLLAAGWWEGELEHTRRDGSKVLVSSHWTLERDAQQRPLAVMEVNTDITVQRQVTESIARERNLLRTLLDHSPDCVYVKDRDSRFIMTNSEHLRVIGASRVEDVIGKTDHDIFPPDLADRYLEDEREVVASGRPLLNREEPVRDAQGRIRWYLASKVPLFDDAGNITGLVGVSRDVTERKQAQEKLEAAMQELQSSREELKALSRKLVMVQERERRHVAEQLYNDAGQLLAAYMIQLRLLENDLSEDAESRVHMDEMRDIVDAILLDLHDLAVDLRPAHLDRLGLVSALRQYLEDFGKRQCVEIQMETVGMDDVRLRPDLETAVYRIVQEALANVAEHAQAGLVGIMLRCDADRLRVLVEDNGAGFDPAEGMRHGGLGLVAIRERAEALGGTMSVESKPGAGTIVSVEIPLGEGLAPDQE